MTFIVGLTGLIGSGKSIVANIFKDCGVGIIDTDIISHDITSHDANTILEIKKEFGEQYINNDGALNRTKMRNLIFMNDNARAKFDNILHPKIYNQTLEMLKKTSAPLVILVVPLLFKVDIFLKLINYSIFVDCDINTIYKRLGTRNNLSKFDVDNIIKTQIKRELQLMHADEVIENNSSVENLTINVKIIYNKLIKKIC